MTNPNQPQAASDPFDFMSQMDPAFNATPGELETEATSGKVPDGTYLTVIDNAAVDISKRSHDHMFFMEFQITTGIRKNRKFRKFHMLSSKGHPLMENIPRIKGDLELLGMRLPKFSDLKTQAPTLKGAVVIVKLVTRGDFQSVFLQRRVNDAAEIAALTATMGAPGFNPNPAATGGGAAKAPTTAPGGGGPDFGESEPPAAAAGGSADIPF